MEPWLPAKREGAQREVQAERHLELPGVWHSKVEQKACDSAAVDGQRDAVMPRVSAGSREAALAASHGQGEDAQDGDARAFDETPAPPMGISISISTCGDAVYADSQREWT